MIEVLIWIGLLVGMPAINVIGITVAFSTSSRDKAARS